jgi:hypothetical protein
MGVQDRIEQVVTCAACESSFAWGDAYLQDRTPGATFNPGKGDLHRRVFCPKCGSLVAEGLTDAEIASGIGGGHELWKWFGENGTVNTGGELPPPPFAMWGHPLREASLAPIEQTKIDPGAVEVEF